MITRTRTAGRRAVQRDLQSASIGTSPVADEADRQRSRRAQSTRPNEVANAGELSEGPPPRPQPAPRAPVSELPQSVRYCTSCRQSLFRKPVPGQSVCWEHYYARRSRSGRQCTTMLSDGHRCHRIAALSFDSCGQHLAKQPTPPQPESGDVVSELDESDLFAAEELQAPLGFRAPQAAPLPRAELEASHTHTPVEAAEDENEPPRRFESIPQSVIEYLTTIPDIIRLEIENEFAVGPPQAVPVTDALALRFAERLADSIPGAAFARPCASTRHVPRRDGNSPILALDSPVADVLVDPITGNVFVRLSLASTFPKQPASHCVLSLEEMAAYYPQILIDFLLASVVFQG